MADLRRTLEVVVPVGDELGIDLFGAGTHPFASWTVQQLTEGHRYAELINRTQWWGRQMLIWGVHVHVGMPERSRVMSVMSSLLNQYPHLQALSASSPIWAGVDTGYASNRALMFQQLPTAGLPFQFTEWSEFEAYVDDELTTGVIDELTEVRWDVRPAPHLGTLENRVCDGVSTFADLSALVALMHCLVVDLDTRLAAGEELPMLPPWHVQENKWRAARYGLEAIIILDADSHEALLIDDLKLPRRPPGAGGRAARLLGRARVGARHPRARGVVPAAAGGGRLHGRGPGGGRGLGGAGTACGAGVTVELTPLTVDHAVAMVDVLSDPSLYEFTGGTPPTLEELTDRYARQASGAPPTAPSSG